MSDFAALPKVDLNMDLLMAANPRVVKDLAWRAQQDISGAFAEDGGYRFGDYDFFWRLYQALGEVVRGPDAWSRLGFSALEQAARSGVVYTELWLSPDICGGDLGAWQEILAAFGELRLKARAEFGIEFGLLATILRQIGPEQAKKSALIAAETAGDGVIGLAVAGDERVLLPKNYAWSLDCVREAGLKTVVNCAFATGYENLKAIVTELAPDRIGHGAGVISDLALVDELAERGVMLDLCPASDVAFGAYKDYRSQPIGELDRRGVKIGVASEYPAFTRSSMAREYQQIHRAFDWDEAQFRRIAGHSLSAAFCDNDMKNKISKMLEA